MIHLIFPCLVAIAAGWGFHKLKLPPLLGYLLSGFILGPHILSNVALGSGPFPYQLYIRPEVLESFSPFIRAIALMIILLRAGLHLKWEDLKATGRPSLLMSFIPLCLEVLVIYHLSQFLFHFSALEASLLAFCLTAVSPAVIVPSMLKLIHSNQGMQKRVPIIILAGASLDDVLAIAGFSAMLTLAQQSEELSPLVSVPTSILSGAFIGIGSAYVWQWVLPKVHHAWAQVSLLLLTCALFYYLDAKLKLPFSSIIAMMSLGLALARFRPGLCKAIGSCLKHLWKPAELLLFLFVGATLAPSALFQANHLSFLLIVLGLLARSLGVLLSLTKTPLTFKEKLFCVLAYTPKATVQAAIGGLALQLVLQNQLHLEHGQQAAETILALSVMAIAITAPFGAIAIHKTTHWLKD